MGCKRAVHSLCIAGCASGVSHVSTECDYPLGEKREDVIPDEWAVSQSALCTCTETQLSTQYTIKSSVDYGHDSWLTAFFSGALNYQSDTGTQRHYCSSLVKMHLTCTPNATAFCTAAISVTHHLYPGVSQYHYPAIAPIIKQTCKEYGIEYKCLPTFAAAFHAHIKHLKNMGARGEPAELHMG
eukprot:3719-Heterococcus_DN1.PRE.2